MPRIASYRPIASLASFFLVPGASMHTYCTEQLTRHCYSKQAHHHAPCASSPWRLTKAGDACRHLAQHQYVIPSCFILYIHTYRIERWYGINLHIKSRLCIYSPLKKEIVLYMHMPYKDWLNYLKICRLGKYSWLLWKVSRDRFDFSWHLVVVHEKRVWSLLLKKKAMERHWQGIFLL